MFSLAVGGECGVVGVEVAALFRWLLAGLVFGLTASPSRCKAAPPVGAKVEESRQALLSLGWEPTWVVGLEFQYGLHPVTELPLHVYGRADLPVVLLAHLQAWRLEAGAGFDLWRHNRWGVRASLAATLTRGKDPLASTLSLGVDARVWPGFEMKSGTLGLDLGYVGTLSSYLKHSQRVVDLFEDGSRPRDGWYVWPSHRLQFGIFGGGVWQEIVSFYGRGGFDYMPNRVGLVSNGMHGQLPFYLRVGGGYRW